MAARAGDKASVGTCTTYRAGETTRRLSGIADDEFINQSAGYRSDLVGVPRRQGNEHAGGGMGRPGEG